MTDAYRDAGIAMAPAERITEGMRGKALARSLVLAPLSARGTPWMKRLPNASVAFASGLMRVRGVRRQRAFDRGFVLSDHADWPALLATIAETGASRVLVTHGWSEALARYLAEERGLETGTIRTAFEGETGELTEPPARAYFLISAAIACTLALQPARLDLVARVLARRSSRLRRSRRASSPP